MKFNYDINLLLNTIFQVQTNKMYVASGTHGIVYLINLEGQLLRKCGLKRVRGEEGQFNEPHICHGDMFGSIMIADKQNECLQVWLYGFII